MGRKSQKEDIVREKEALVEGRMGSGYRAEDSLVEKVDKAFVGEGKPFVVGTVQLLEDREAMNMVDS